MNENKEIQELLVAVAAINKKYENIEEVTGANFNIFKIMRMETDEVRTHSRFIAELLNPNGSHGQKDVFLKLFTKAFKIPDEFDQQGYDIKRTKIKVEEVGENGRIDIVLKFTNGQIVVIENKIKAGDQYGQLARYKHKYQKCYLTYLTLEGNKASNGSLVWKNEKGDEIKLVHHVNDKHGEGDKCDDCYFTFSYKADILNWLKDCQKEAAGFPILRETIVQYINLIKHLTHQTMSDLETKEVIEEVIKNSARIAAAQEIFNNWHNIEKAVMVKFQSSLEQIKNELDIELNIDFGEKGELGNDGSGFWFYRHGGKYCIYFCFLEEYYMQYGIGLVHTDQNNKSDKSLMDLLIVKLGTSNTIEEESTWLWVTTDPKLDEYGFEEFVTETYKEYIKGIITDLLKKIDEALKDQDFENN